LSLQNKLHRAEPSSYSDRLSAGQEVAWTSWNLKLHNHVYRDLIQDLLLSQIKPFLPSRPTYSQFYCYIISTCRQRASWLNWQRVCLYSDWLEYRTGQRTVHDATTLPPGERDPPPQSTHWVRASVDSRSGLNAVEKRYVLPAGNRTPFFSLQTRSSVAMQATFWWKFSDITSPDIRIRRKF
jgi:hypothetical protein